MGILHERLHAFLLAHLELIPKYLPERETVWIDVIETN
jgi:hypothetical protein